MHPPILRCLVTGAAPAAGPTVEPGEIAPVPALIAIEALAAYLREVNLRREDRRVWEGLVEGHQIRDRALQRHCSVDADHACATVQPLSASISALFLPPTSTINLNNR